MAEATTNAADPGMPIPHAQPIRSVSSAGLELALCDVPGGTVLALAGELDVATTPMLDGYFSKLDAQSHPHVVVDVSGLTFCDCAGVNALVRALRLTCAAGGWVRLCGAGPDLARIMRAGGAPGL